jgi:hypothetical protein
MDILKKIYDEKLSSDDAIDLIDDARVLYNKDKEARVVVVGMKWNTSP